MLALAAVAPARAQTPPSVAPPQAYEIVKDDIDMEFLPGGHTLQEQTLVYRALTEQGVQALQQARFSFTPEYEVLEVREPKTIKKDGTVVRVGSGDVLYGRGASSGTPGFEDIVTATVIFPKLEVGDEISLQLIRTQRKAWFNNVYAFDLYFSSSIATREANIALTAPDALAVRIDAVGLDADQVEHGGGGKARRTWHYHSDVAAKLENDAAIDPQKEPHLSVGTLADYGAVAALYRDAFRDKQAVSDSVRTLADSLTKDVSDPKDKARILYDWVSGHIRYVAIVLGAGGFVPHTADQVLKNGYGDCKDHVMLLESLLTAEGIGSSPVLIQAGTARYDLPGVATPFGFNHLITFIPQFDEFADSTAQYAPFGVLPAEDASRAVVIVNSGEVVKAPAGDPPSVRANIHVKVNADGSADGDSIITATGSWAISYRALAAAVPPDKEQDFFRAFLGPGASGHLEPAEPKKLTDPYQFSAHFHLANFANLPGPGALPSQMGFKPFSFTQLIGASLPDRRDTTYRCESGIADEDVTVTLPGKISPFSLPASRSLKTEGTEFRQSFEKAGPHAIRAHVSVKLQHAGPVCTSAYYNKVHDDLARMVRSLNAQVLYK
jgi:hypothetical protein